MPLRRENTRLFHRTLYGPGILETVRLLKRKDDQLQGTVTAYTLYNCRRSKTHKTKETIQSEMAAEHWTIWHVPLVELERHGLTYLNALDRIVQLLEGPEKGRVWQPESSTLISQHILGNEVHFKALRVDPPLLREGYPQGYFG